MIIHRVKIKDGLLGDLYLNKKKDICHGTIVFIPGLPSYQHKNLFAEELSLMGFHVLQPFYYGSWVSSGEFTVKNCFKTAHDSITAISQGKLFDLYTQQNIVVSEPIYFGGISFGTNIIQSLPASNSIKKIFLISAVPIFKTPYPQWIDISGTSFVRFLKEGFPFAYRTNDWEEWIQELSGTGELLNRFFVKGEIRIYQGEKDPISPKIIKKYLEAEKLSINMKIVKGARHAINEFNQKTLAKSIYKYLTSS